MWLIRKVPNIFTIRFSLFIFHLRSHEINNSKSIYINPLCYHGRWIFAYIFSTNKNHQRNGPNRFVQGDRDLR